MEVKNQHQQLYKPPANIHQTTSRPTSPNNPPEIHNVLVSTGTPFKSITSSTNYPISDRQSKASKTRKKNKSSSRFLSPHRSETETSFLAASGPSFKSIHSSSTHPSSDRSENLSQTEKKNKPNSRFSSPTRSDLPPSPHLVSGTFVNEQLQSKPGYDVITTAASIHGLAGAAEVAGAWFLGHAVELPFWQLYMTLDSSRAQPGINSTTIYLFQLRLLREQKNPACCQLSRALTF